MLLLHYVLNDCFLWKRIAAIFIVYPVIKETAVIFIQYSIHKIKYSTHAV